MLTEILANLFGLIVAGGIIFWVFAKAKGKTVAELYNDIMDKIFGTEYDDIGFDTGKFKLKRLRNVKVRKVALHNIRKSNGKFSNK